MEEDTLVEIGRVSDCPLGLLRTSRSTMWILLW